MIIAVVLLASFCAVAWMISLCQPEGSSTHCWRHDLGGSEDPSLPLIVVETKMSVADDHCGHNGDCNNSH